jgi:hypothetical protein
MKQIIEVTSLNPKIDPISLQMKAGIMLSYKSED